MERSHWRQFIGLPHRTGADPCTEDAADCLLVAFAVLDEIGFPHPPVDPQWFAMAERGLWPELRNLLYSLTIPATGESGDVALAQSGLIVSIGGGVLLAQHSRGVRWVPMELLGPRDWRRFR